MSVVNARRLHRLLGLILLLPMLGWAVTGFVFLTKPGYQKAFEIPQVRSYPLAGTAYTEIPDGWLETRRVRTVLGDHLLVRDDSGWQQLDSGTLAVRPLPDTAALQALVADAIASYPDRYGSVETAKNNQVLTSTGVRITVDWNTLTLQQSGQDTRLINGLYKLHYLQWTGVDLLDRILGAVGILLLLAMTVLGVRLLLR